MLVIADSSPLNTLIEIAHVSALATLFTRVVIPTQVAVELTHARAPTLVREFIHQQPSWLEILEPTQIEEIPELDLGERAAISLAGELHPDFLLIDERLGRQRATARNIAVIGTIGVLERGANAGPFDLEQAFRSLKKTRFHVSDALLDHTLRRHKEQRS